MPIPVKGIDHFVIRVADLDAGEALFRRLGFVLTPRGFHTGRGSSNHTAPLAGGNYFELIHLGSNPSPSPFGARAEGAVAVALEPIDSRSVHAELRALGYEVPEPRDLSRPVELPQGTREARFLNASLPPIPPQAVAFFTCQHLTRDLVWRPEWEGHANGAQRVTDIIAVHPSPAEFAETHRRIFGEDRVNVGAECLTITLGPDRIVILTPGAFTARYPGVSLPADLIHGWFAGAAFRTASLEAVAAALAQAGITSERAPSGSLVVAPHDAAQTLLEFHAGRTA
jgi:hypothetical protein